VLRLEEQRRKSQGVLRMKEQRIESQWVLRLKEQGRESDQEWEGEGRVVEGGVLMCELVVGQEASHHRM
jgi:hypothetical protein